MPKRDGTAKSMHPLKIGTAVVVFGFDPAEGPFIEGWGFITAACLSYGHWYRVRFADEKIHRVRLVIEGFQKDPEGSCALLRELWRTHGSSPFDDFWPPEKQWEDAMEMTKAQRAASSPAGSI
jgi:hypothetical protein